MADTRLFVFTRHAESTANVARVVSSDPAHHHWQAVGRAAAGVESMARPPRPKASYTVRSHVASHQHPTEVERADEPDAS